jgi:hypothetical protein
MVTTVGLTSRPWLIMAAAHAVAPDYQVTVIACSGQLREAVRTASSNSAGTSGARGSV